MTSPTQSAMEQQQREAFEAWARGRDLSVERLSPSDPPPPGFTYESFVTERYWQCWENCAKQNASELRSLRDSLALARSRIAELEGEPRFSADDVDAAAEHCGISDGYRDMLAGALRYMALRAALNKEQP